ncbi:MAG: hypothetical protein AAF889_01670 [Cyanobacteria bacterium P01_D01_bin.73]
MQLPAIVDIAIGLLFIYLILSLLASELQELVATLLQWRAEHLKRSVEMMLAGGSEPTIDGMSQDEVTADLNRAKDLADRVYNNPLINTLNYEAAGILARFFRRIFNGFYTFFRFNTNIFGDRNGGPSYIPSATFADALTSTLRIPDIVRLVSAKRLSIFARNVVVGVRHILQPHLSDPVVAQAIDRFSKRLGLILADYRNEKFDLLSSLVRLERTTDQFIETLQVRAPQIGTEELVLYRNEIFQQDDNHQALLATLLPTVDEILRDIQAKRGIYNEIYGALQDIDDPNSKLRQNVERALDILPQSTQDSLGQLAAKVRSKTQEVQNDVAEFQKEVEAWYGRAQDRAAGVYRRNARGMSLVLGLILAVASNADTFYIVRSLSRNTILRQAVTNYAEQAIVEIKPEDLQDNDKNLLSQPAIRESLDPALNDIALPIGWGLGHWEKQMNPDPQNPPRDFFSWLWIRFRVLAGWVVTGIAISMGAPFWFDLLSKLVRVKRSKSSS